MRIELRNGAINLDGYVNVVNRHSRVLHEEGAKFIEHITPGAFKRALENADDVALLFNHDKGRVLGSIKQGNLNLKEDVVGLRAKCRVTDAEVINKARSNQLRGWSFGFKYKDVEKTTGEDGIERRAVKDLELFEVSILDKTPAYFATSIETRNENGESVEIRCYEELEVDATHDKDCYQRNLNLLKLYKEEEV